MCTKKNKNVFHIFLIPCLMAIFFTGCTESEGDEGMSSSGDFTTTIQSEEFVDSTQSKLDDINYYVDDEIEKMVESAEYKNATIDERKNIANSLLLRLKKEKAIKRFSYSKDSYLFSFTYKNGTLGGIYLKDFNTQFNGSLNNQF